MPVYSKQMQTGGRSIEVVFVRNRDVFLDHESTSEDWKVVIYACGRPEYIPTSYYLNM
jgi:hypothetical protein